MTYRDLTEHTVCYVFLWDIRVRRALHTGGATLGRGQPATRTSEAGGTGLAYLERPMWRSAVEDRLAFAFYASARAADRPRKSSVAGGRSLGTAIRSSRAPPRSLLIEVLGVQAGTCSATSRIIGDREQTSV